MARKYAKEKFDSPWDAGDDDTAPEIQEEVVLETPKHRVYNTINLVNLISAKVKLLGPVTGNSYEWSKAGAVLAVDEKDAPGLLSKHLGDKVCCGSNAVNSIFAIKE